MEGVRTKEAYNGTAFNDETQSIYETNNSGDWKTWYVIPLDDAKGVQNKGRGYTSAYVPGADHNKKAKI